jgi:hypothetical protein
MGQWIDLSVAPGASVNYGHGAEDANCTASNTLCGGGFMDFIHRPKSKILKIFKN